MIRTNYETIHSSYSSSNTGQDPYWTVRSHHRDDCIYVTNVMTEFRHVAPKIATKRQRDKKGTNIDRMNTIYSYGTTY